MITVILLIYAGLLEGFTFAGLLSLIDPPRAAVPAAVDDCRAAAVRNCLLRCPDSSV